MNIIAKSMPEFEEILTPEALAFVEGLEREFGPRRLVVTNTRRTPKVVRCGNAARFFA